MRKVNIIRKCNFPQAGWLDFPEKVVSYDAFQMHEKVNTNRTPLLMQASVVEVFHNHKYLSVLTTRALYSTVLDKGPFLCRRGGGIRLSWCLFSMEVAI